jgi:hypothetical protein
MTQEELRTYVERAVRDALAQRVGPSSQNLVPLNISARHLHIRQDHLEILFGPGAQLTKLRDLLQPGEFAANETVTVVGPNRRVFEQVRILGGATKSELWNQMQADVYNRPVETLKMTDAALMGAALCAAVGVGEFPGIAEGAERMVQVDKKYTPDPKKVGLYDEIYGIYCLAYEALEEKGVFQALAKLQAGY